MARIAVGVTAGHQADGHLLRGFEREAVAHVLARLQVLQADDLAGQRHRRLQPEVRGALTSANGEQPYSMIPGRTQSACDCG
jgi:hypothetical protein